jgi:hypothetical protein
MRTLFLLAMALLSTSAAAAPVPKELKKQAVEEIDRLSDRVLLDERYMVGTRTVLLAFDVQERNTPNPAKLDRNSTSFFWVFRRVEK